MSKPETPSSSTYSCASQRHFGWMPAASPASAPVTKSQVTNSHLRRGLSGIWGEGRGSREGEAQPPGSRGAGWGGSVCSEASVTTPAGNAPHTAPARASLPHGPGGLGLNKPGSFIPARPRSAHLPPAPAPAVTPRPPGPPSAAGQARRPHRAPTTAPAPRSGLTVRRRRLHERTVSRRRRRWGPTAAEFL